MLALGELGHDAIIEVGECETKIAELGQSRSTGQFGLKTLERDYLEQLLIVRERENSLSVVISVKVWCGVSQSLSSVAVEKVSDRHWPRS